MRLSTTARRRGSVAAVAGLVAGFVVVAAQADGYDVPEPDLHDGAIWVTNEDRGLVGRTNSQIATVDTRLAAGTTDFDVLQSGDVVVLHQQDPPALVGIDPALASLVPGPDLAPGAQVGLGATTAALFDPATGALYVVPATSSTAVLALDPASDIEPVHAVAGDATLAVGVDGLVHLYDHDTGELRTFDVDGDEVATAAAEPDLADVQLSAVGDRPVLLSGDRLLVPGEDDVVVDVGDLPVLQEPGPDAPGALVAGDLRLVEVTPAGDARELHAGGTGDAARPVRVGGCAFGAWGADPTYVQVCGDGEPASAPVPEMDAAVELRFRVNHDRVTLNSLTDGNQLLFGDGDPIFIDNRWVEARTDEIEFEPEAEEEVDELTDPTCENPANGEPVAEDDTGIFGTRRDRPVVVQPLRNDTDPDCDVLLVDSATPVDPAAGTIGVIDGGRALQVDLATEVDRLEFEYTISDGRGGRATATGDVTVVPDERNDPPVVASDEETFVVTGGTVTHNVLATAFDPDGDVLRLVGAEEEGPASGTVRTSPRGDITFTAGNTPGEVDIAYVVADGRGGEQTGLLSVTVAERRENQAPVARNDAEATFVGREVVVDVLDNDTDPNGDELSIVRAVAGEDAQVRWDPSSPEIRVTSTRAGTVNVVYRVTDGQATDEAVLRVDFRERGEQQPPIAVRDEVLLAAGEPAFVPVLDNDVAADGQVLVVLGVTDLPDPSPITVTVLQRSVLEITAPTELTEPVELGYRISDGTEVADGRVLVEPASPDRENRPPVVNPDEYTVRAGGVVTLPVLSNDSDPDGDAIEIVAPPLDQPLAAQDGRLFLSDDGQLRYEAPQRPRADVRLVYSVSDVADNVASAEVTLQVLPPNPDRNQPPIAPELVGRTIAGQTVTIPVPVTTMDPDGDTVTLVGIDEPPGAGTVTAVRPDELVYRADDDAAGTDELTYVVEDQFGARASATILIGVAGRPARNAVPIPTDDQAFVRPGSTVSIPVLANDLDPDADPLRVVADGEDAPSPQVGAASVDGSAIRYTAPPEPDVPQTSFRYTVDDGRGGRASAVVTLTFQDEDANRPPIAVDDVTDPQLPATPLELPLLDNDEDPDGDPLEITEVSLDGATIAADGRSVTFTMPERPVQFTYLVSDGTDVARAAVSVPFIDPAGDRPPVAVLDDDIEVGVGESVTIDVLANDDDPEGARVHLLGLVGVRHGSAEIDGDEVVFTASEEGYAGDAGFSYVVGDAADPAVANTSLGSARIRIVGDVNTPPTFTELAVELPQGREQVVDLLAAVDDPDDDDQHTAELVEVVGDTVLAEVDDGALRLEAASGATVGATARVEVLVSDGEDEAPGTVLVTVVGSDAPLATVVPDAATTFEGTPVSVPVLANDTNPFPDDPLVVSDIGQPSGGGGTATAEGGAVRFDPAPGFSGETSFPYTVADATGAPEREVTGTVTVTVIGRPSAPPAPTCVGGTSGSVRVQWVAPSANGAPISGYVLRVGGDGAGTGERQVSNASTQDVGGLTNGGAYTFAVAALNEAVGPGGEPNFSPPSPTRCPASRRRPPPPSATAPCSCAGRRHPTPAAPSSG